MSYDHGINIRAVGDTLLTGTSVPVQLSSGTSVVGKVSIDQTTPGTTNYAETRTSVRRATATHHRTTVSSVDKLSAPTVSAASAVTESGSTLANSAYNYTAAAGNRWGPTTGASVQSITPTANQAVRIPIAQVSGADYYDIFLSTDAAPKWVARITETQRAAGGFIVSSVGTVTAGGGASAGQVDIGVAGTGLAWNVAPFSVNNAFTPASITAIDCTGYNTAYIFWKLSVTDLRSIPTFSMMVFNQSSGSTGDWHRLGVFTESILTAGQNPLESVRAQSVNGATGLVVVVDTLTGQGTSVDIWVELV